MAAAPAPQVLASLHQWHGLTARIQNYEAQQVEAALAAAQQQLAIAKKAADTKQEQVAELQAKVRKDTKKVAKAEDPFFLKKIIMPKKCEDRKEKTHAALESDTKYLELRNQSLEQRTAELQRARALAAQLKGEVAQLNATRGQEEQMVEGLFSGPYPPIVDNGTEMALRTTHGALLPQLAALQQYMHQYATAYRLLCCAEDQMEQAAQLLGSALGLANLDVLESVIDPWGPNMGNMMLDVMKNNQCNEGVMLAREAVRQAIEAKRLCPDTPRIDVQHVQSLGMAFQMFDMIFDNVFTDIVVQQRIADIHRRIVAMVDDLRWMETTLSQRMEADNRALVNQISVAKTNLFNHRRMLMHRALFAPAAGALPPTAAGPVYAPAPAQAAPQAPAQNWLTQGNSIPVVTATVGGGQGW